MTLNLSRLQQGILPLGGACVSFCLAALLQEQRTRSRQKSERRPSRRDRGDERAALPEFLLLRHAEWHCPQHPHPVAHRQVLQVVHQTLPLHGCDAQEGGDRVSSPALPPASLFPPPPHPHPSPPLTLGVVAFRLDAVAPDARPARVREDLDGGSALPAPPQLHGPVVVLGDDGAPAAA